MPQVQHKVREEPETRQVQPRTQAEPEVRQIQPRAQAEPEVRQVQRKAWQARMRRAVQQGCRSRPRRHRFRREVVRRETDRAVWYRRCELTV